MPFILPIINIIKPFIFHLIVAVAIWTHGYSVGHEDFNELTRTLEKDARDRKAKVKEVTKIFTEKMVSSNEDSEKIAEANRLVIEGLVDRNVELVNNRVQRDSRNCGNTKATHTGAASNSNEENTGTRTFLEVAGTELTEKVKEADDIVESLRSCQTYITSLKEQIDENWNRLETSKH